LLGKWLFGEGHSQHSRRRPPAVDSDTERKMILKGSINLTRALLEHDIWQQDLATRAAAVDLILRANNRPGTISLNGQRVHLERGQVGWSKRNLAQAWGCSEEKLAGILRFLEDRVQFIRMEKCGPRGTIITVVNYDRYNPPSHTNQCTEPGAEPVTDLDTETATNPHTEPGAEPERNREIGKGNRKGEGEHPCFDVPSDDEVSRFCDEFQDLARGISGIPAVWWTGWLSMRLSSGRPFPQDWRRVLKLAFISDWVACHPKARGGSLEKNGEKKGRSIPAQQYLRDQELKAIQLRAEAAYAIGLPPDVLDEKREVELKLMETANS